MSIILEVIITRNGHANALLTIPYSIIRLM